MQDNIKVDYHAKKIAHNIRSLQGKKLVYLPYIKIN